MDVPSTSSASLNDDTEYEGPVYAELVSSTNEHLFEHNEPGDAYPELLGFIEAQIEFCDQFLLKISAARKRLAEKKALLEKKAEQERLSRSLAKAKVPVIQYLPPYFKDESMMCPPQNEEAKHKLQYTTFDSLVKEDKKWTAEELRLLRETVKASLIHAGIQKFIDRKDVLRAKIQRAGVDTASEEVQGWKDELEAINRKIQHYRNGMMDSHQPEMIDYSCVDWLKISTVDFKGTRSAATLRYKWLNEQCPRWNSGPWTKEELQNLKQYREDPSFSSWAALAKKLQTQRSPYQCFERYRSDLYRRTKEWTKEEDDRLIALVKVMTVNGNVQWDKVTFYMPGRHRQQVRSRYQRTLDENVRHGRWTDQEDLLLMSAVARFGAKDWNKIAKAVYGRSDGQCRERWCNVLDKCTESGDWTPEEDERLALGIRVFGREKWSKIAEILPRHSPESVRNRYQQLLTAKMRICTARLSGRTVNQSMSQTSAAIAKAKRDLLRRQLTDDSIKGEFYRAAKEQARRFPGRRTSSSLRRETLTPEEKAIVEKGIEEIAQKFRNGEKTPSIGDVLKKIDLSEREITSIVNAAKRRSMCQRTRQIQCIGSMPVKKIAKNSLLLPDTVWERTEFPADVSEEERTMCLTEALCQAVHRYDRHEWGSRFNDNRECAETAVSAFVSGIMNDKCSEVATSLRECRSAPSGATLPPTFSSVGAYAVFERVRPSLTTKASKYFNPSVVFESEILPNGEVFRKFTAYDRLNIQLHPNLLMDPNYLKLKAQVRCLLFEPTFLAMAIEPPEVEEQRIRTQMELTQMEIDEQNHFPDSAIMDDAVVGDIEVAADDNEPISYEDSGDDALNDTIHTVMDKVFNPTAIKRRGRPRKGDIFAAYERWIKKNRQKIQPPRSAKSKANPLVNLMDGASDSSDNFSLDSGDEGQQPCPEMQQSDAVNRESGDEPEMEVTVRTLVREVSRSIRKRAKKTRNKEQQQSAGYQDQSKTGSLSSTSSRLEFTGNENLCSNEGSGSSRLNRSSKRSSTAEVNASSDDQVVQDVMLSILEKVCATENVTPKRKRGRAKNSESAKVQKNSARASRAKRPRRS